MNAKNSLLVLGAIMLLVWQLFGNDTTIASIASADNAELQEAMANGEDALREAALDRGQVVKPTVQSASNGTDETSLTMFYGNNDLENSSTNVIDSRADVDPDDDDSAGGNIVTATPQVSAAPVAPARQSRPVEPWRTAPNN